MFTFSEESKKKLDTIIAKYPVKKAALLPALYVAQEQNDGWVSREAMKAVADYLELAPADVEGVATFYTMYNKAPVGKFHLEVCHNVMCMVRGADELIEHMAGKLGIEKGETTPDRKFTLNGAECLGACANAPCMMVGDTYYEDLTPAQADKIIEDLARK